MLTLNQNAKSPPPTAPQPTLSAAKRGAKREPVGGCSRLFGWAGCGSVQTDDGLSCAGRTGGIRLNPKHSTAMFVSLLNRCRTPRGSTWTPPSPSAVGVHTCAFSYFSLLNIYWPLLLCHRQYFYVVTHECKNTLSCNSLHTSGMSKLLNSLFLFWKI